MNAMLKVYLNVLNAITNEEGQGMAEYGLILALVAVVVIAALTLSGRPSTNLHGSSQDNVALVISDDLASTQS